MVPGRRASSEAGDNLGVEGDANRDRGLQTAGGWFRQGREIREAHQRGAYLPKARDDLALQDEEILS
jgi:hypothetical protein